MSLRTRLPALALALVALVLTALVVSRVSAGADPAPQNTKPIVVTPSATPTPTEAKATTPAGDDGFTQVTPVPRGIDDHGGDDTGGDDGDSSGHGGGDDDSSESDSSGTGSGGGDDSSESDDTSESGKDSDGDN